MPDDLFFPEPGSAFLIPDFSIIALRFNDDPLRIVFFRIQPYIWNAVFPGFVDNPVFGRISEQSPKEMCRQWSVKANFTCDGTGSRLFQIFF